MDLNSLQQYMDFAEKNGLFSQYRNLNAGGNGFNPTQFNVPMMEANWARSVGGNSLNTQMPQGNQFPDYFSGFGKSPQPGVTIGDNPYSARVNALFAAKQAPTQAPQMGNNYLARFLR